MVIEWLRIKVSSESREKFIAVDKQIWTNFLEQQSGFLSKQVWLDPTNSEEVILVTQWQTLKQWKSIPKEQLQEIEEQFVQALLPAKSTIVESKEYQIRKFSG